MQNKGKKIRVALFHPWIKSKGGAEKVVLDILENSKQKIDCYTWVYDKNKTFKEFKKFPIKILAPKICEKFSRFYVLRGLFFPISLFSKISLHKYDLFLISTAGLAELITLRNYKPKKTIAYVHTILRASYKENVKWNLKKRYPNMFSKILYLISVKIYRILERISWKRIDEAIFNSKLTLQRAKDHHLLKNTKTHIVNPSIDVKRFKKVKIKKGDYFLYVSRFNLDKRQDLIIKAWKNFSANNPKYKLILTGNIENKKYFDYLCKLSKNVKNIEIKTNLENQEVTNLYTNCFAVIFVPFMEDFGIVPFEALAAGKPLLATDKGGYVDLIKKFPQFVKIEEKEEEGEMIKEISKVLTKFVRVNIKTKSIFIKNVGLNNFNQKIEEIFKNSAGFK